MVGILRDAGILILKPCQEFEFLPVLVNILKNSVGFAFTPATEYN